MSTDQRHQLGQIGEDHAARHFERLGYEVVARNHRTRFGELDLIVRDGGLLAFVEVKTRRVGSGRPFDNLHERKRRQVRSMSAAWLKEANRPWFESLRFDAVGVIVAPDGTLLELEHLEGAF